MAIGYQIGSNIGTGFSEQFPGLDEKEIKAVKSGSIDYATAIKQKTFQEDKIKKEKAVNSTFYNFFKKGDKVAAEGTYKTTKSMDKLVEIIRNRAEANGIPHIDYDDKTLINKWKNKYGEDVFTDYLNKGDDVLKSIGYIPSNDNNKESFQSQIPGAIATLGAGVTAGGIMAMQGKQKLETVKSRQKQSIIEGTNIPKTLKEQRAGATILDDVLNVSNAARVDRDAIIKEFSKEYGPVSNFNELLDQAKYKLQDTPGSFINKRNNIIKQYSTTHADEYLKPLEDYIKQLEANPQAVGKIDTAKTILENEKAFLETNGGKLTTEALETRKEQLNKDLGRFFNKDKSLMSEVEDVTHQALSKIQNGAMTEIEKIAAGTPEENLIKQLNKQYQTNLHIKQLAEGQATKFKKVKAPNTIEKIVTKIRTVTKSTPVINTLTNWMKSMEMTKNQNILYKLETAITRSKKVLTKAGEELSKRMPKGKLTTAVDPTAAPLMAEFIFEIIENNTKKGGFTNKEANKLKDSFSRYNSTSPGVVATEALFSTPVTKKGKIKKIMEKYGVDKIEAEKIWSGESDKGKEVIISA